MFTPTAVSSPSLAGHQDPGGPQSQETVGQVWKIANDWKIRQRQVWVPPCRA